MMKNLIDLILWTKKSHRPGASKFCLRTALAAGALASGLATSTLATDWTIGPYDPADPLSAAIISTDDGDYVNLTNSTGATTLQNGDNFIFQSDDLLFFGGDASMLKQIGAITTQNDKQGALLFGMGYMDPEFSALKIGDIGSEDKWLENVTADGGAILIQNAWVESVKITQIDPSIPMNISFANANIGALSLSDNSYAQISNEAKIGVFTVKENAKAQLMKSTIGDMSASDNTELVFYGEVTINRLTQEGASEVDFYENVTVTELTQTFASASWFDKEASITSMDIAGTAGAIFAEQATIGTLKMSNTGRSEYIYTHASAENNAFFVGNVTINNSFEISNSSIASFWGEETKIAYMTMKDTSAANFARDVQIDTLVMSNTGANPIWKSRDSLQNIEFSGSATIGTLEMQNQSDAAFYNGATITDMTMGGNTYAGFHDDTTITNLMMRGGAKIDFAAGVNATISNFTETSTLENNSSAAIIELYKDTNLTLESGVFEGRIIRNAVGDNATVTKVDNSTLALSGSNDYWGGTFINEGTLEARDIWALGGGSVTLASGAILRIGNQDARTSNSLNVNSGSWTSNGNLELVASTQGTISRLSILEGVNVFGTTAVKIVGQMEDINRWGGQVVAAGLTANSLILANSIVDTNAFVFESVVLLDKQGNRTEVASTLIDGTQRFETSRYGFEFTPAVRTGTIPYTTWNMTLVEQPVLVPDLATMVLTNIIGFEIPRAQNVNGPWVRMKGGELNDDKAHFDKTTYQSLQVGWDKTFKAANGNGSWNAGMFFEGDWSYGKGNWSSMWKTIQGNLKSKATGVGAGLYVSRGFKSGWYGDVIGRINVFENEVTMKTFKGAADNNYEGKWSNSIFNLALEFGKDISSRDGRWTFNPYNRLIYTNAPGRQFNVVFDDLSIVKVNNRAVDAWTNKLGARLAYNDKCKHRKTKSIYYIGADWYRGLSGRFITQTLDTLNPTAVANNDWKINDSNRPKNNLDYGTVTFGTTFLPCDVFAVTAQADVLFGDVDGWSVSLSGKFSF